MAEASKSCSSSTNEAVRWAPPFSAARRSTTTRACFSRMGARSASSLFRANEKGLDALVGELVFFIARSFLTWLSQTGGFGKLFLSISSILLRQRLTSLGLASQRLRSDSNTLDRSQSGYSFR